MGTYRLRVPASRVVYVPEAQGGLPPGPRVLYVRGTRTSLGRTVRTAYRGTPGYALGFSCAAPLLSPAWLLALAVGALVRVRVRVSAHGFGLP